MTKILLSLLVLSLASALAVAQDTPGGAVPQTSTASQSTSQSTSATPNDQSGSTMRGCLGGMSGNYTLTDDRTGTVYKLTGSIDNLGSKVGHEVEVSGQLASSASSTSSAATPDSSNANASASTTANISNAFQVSNVTDVADHCTNTGSAPSSAANMSTTPAATTADSTSAAPTTAQSSATATSTQPGTTTTSSTTTTTTTAAPSADQPSSPASSTTTAVDRNPAEVKAATTGKEKASEEKTSTGSLPATGSELPLLGLLGLASLAAGLYIRK